MQDSSIHSTTTSPYAAYNSHKIHSDSQSKFGREITNKLDHITNCTTHTSPIFAVPADTHGEGTPTLVSSFVHTESIHYRKKLQNHLRGIESVQNRLWNIISGFCSPFAVCPLRPLISIERLDRMIPSRFNEGCQSPGSCLRGFGVDVVTLHLIPSLCFNKVNH